MTANDEILNVIKNEWNSQASGPDPCQQQAMLHWHPRSVYVHIYMLYIHIHIGCMHGMCAILRGLRCVMSIVYEMSACLRICMGCVSVCRIYGA